MRNLCLLLAFLFLFLAGCAPVQLREVSYRLAPVVESPTLPPSPEEAAQRHIWGIAWRPDGEQLAYQTQAIYTISKQGGEPVKIKPMPDVNFDGPFCAAGRAMVDSSRCRAAGIRPHFWLTAQRSARSLLTMAPRFNCCRSWTKTLFHSLASCSHTTTLLRPLLQPMRRVSRSQLVAIATRGQTSASLSQRAPSTSACRKVWPPSRQPGRPTGRASPTRPCPTTKSLSARVRV